MKATIIIVLFITLLSCNVQKTTKADYEISENETFAITLKSNPTTGYSWKWIKEQPSKIVDSIKSVYIQDKSEPNMVGVGGNEIWEFQGKQRGIETLVFEYCRSWDKNSTITVKKVVVKVK
jgi:inhibitor of cysteine peptidase